ncbi:fatty acid desaturase [Alcanivorax sp.]|uniref:fatty acid desaturase family protein n=1 Tax=Alcanivorax sp. TaxID=1872427 RepID=UPI0025BEC8B5|nr:fatty acid desaturase [Alcanivorax sp.]
MKVRYRADRLAVALVLAVFGIQLVLFFFSHGLATWLGMLALLPVQVSCGAICHNHHHVNTFVKRPLNRLFEMVLYLQTGTSPLSWTLHHNIGHHQLYLDPDNDPSPWQQADGSLMPRWRYVLINTLRIYPEIHRIGRQHPALYRRFLRLLLLANIPLVAAFMLDPRNAFIVFLIPMISMLFMLLDNTYGQHAGTGYEDHFHASRNVELKRYNLPSWNLGYHTAHHMLPGLHWSELPALHAKIRDRIPDHLITENVLLQWEPARQQRQGEGLPS